MRQKVQDKINHMRQHAKSTISVSSTKDAAILRNNDSLSKGIRNSQEASIFLAELNAVIKISSQKKK